jgi:sugar phosphate isomerase/epimerase
MAPAISVQLYSCRAHLDDLDGTLGKLAAIGLKHVEAFNFLGDPEALAASLAKHGLTSPTGHAPLMSDEMRTIEKVIPVPPQEVVLDASKRAGLDWVIDPMTTPERWTTMEGIDDLAARLNSAAAKAAALGLGVGYHNHSMEIVPRYDGRTALEVFADKLDAGVRLEVDVFWATVGGVDAVDLLTKLGSRVGALHVKNTNHDVAGLPMMEAGKLPQAPAGEGKLDMVKIIEAAPTAELVVIEFDTYDGDIFEGVKRSYDYLASLGLS